MVFSPSADVFVMRPLRKNCRLCGRTTKTSAEGENTIGCMYNLDLLMMGLVRPETCRGKRIADIVHRQKNSVSSWK
jgi:late competence protein required for DNA uptake (superfamily II DNA/RNA helicase)